MRFLSSDGLAGLRVSADLDPKTHPYAILSHTWGQVQDEVTFEDIQSGSGKTKTGWEKINFCHGQAKKDNLHYFWVDTCAINKSNNTEFSEAINSMFHWYRDAERCYVYLSDVSVPAGKSSQTQEAWEPEFRACRWFKRGWTLPELLAPMSVQFFSREWVYLGDKASLEDQIRDITGIPVRALRGEPLSQFSYDERFQWAAGRETTKKEDKVYCLLGIFDVFMPLIYGEGDRAMVRLKREIMTSLEQKELPRHSVKVDPYSQNVERTLNQASAPSDSSVKGYQQQPPPDLPYQENRQIEGEPIKKVAQIQQKALPRGKPAQLKSMHTLALLYKESGQIGEGIKLLEEIVQVQQEILPENDLDRLAAESDLARAYAQNGQDTKAIKLMERVVQTRQKILPEDNLDRLNAEHHLALIYEQNALLTEAIKLMERVVQIRQKTLLEDNLDGHNAEFYLGFLYRQVGKHTEGIKLMEKVVQIRQKTLPEDDPDRLDAEHHLARSYAKDGQLTEAIKLMEMVAQIRQKTLPEDNPDRLEAEHWLAFVYERNGQHTEGIKLLEKVVQIRQKTLSEDDPDRLSAEHDLAIIYKQNGQHVEAIKLLKPIVEVNSQPQHLQRQGLTQWLRRRGKKARKAVWFRWSKATSK